MKELTFLLYKELGKLIDEYYNCNDNKVRDQIQCDVQLLNQAILLCNEAGNPCGSLYPLLENYLPQLKFSYVSADLMQQQ